MEKIKAFFKRLAKEILRFLKQVVIIFTKYLIANVIDSILVGILMLVLMLIFRMPHPVILSILSGFMNAIPAIGPVIGAIIGMIVLVFVDWRFALLFMVLTIVIQAVDSYIIKPKLFGDTMGVHPVIMLIIILLASLIGGIPGALLAAPIAGVVMFIIRSYVKPAIKKLKEPKKKKPEVLRIEGPTIYDLPEKTEPKALPLAEEKKTIEEVIPAAETIPAAEAIPVSDMVEAELLEGPSPEDVMRAIEEREKRNELMRKLVEEEPDPGAAE